MNELYLTVVNMKSCSPTHMDGRRAKKIGGEKIGVNLLGRIDCQNRRSAMHMPMKHWRQPWSLAKRCDEYPM